MPSGARKRLYSSNFAKSRSSTSQPSVQLELRMSFTPRGASVPTRFMFTRSGDSTRSGAVDNSTPDWVAHPATRAEQTVARTAIITLPVFILLVPFLLNLKRYGCRRAAP